MPSKLSWKIFCTRCVAILLSLLAPLAALGQVPQNNPPGGEPSFREDRILIIPRAGRAAALNRFHGETGARLRRAFPRLANIQLLELPRGVSARDAVTRYQRSGHVESASLDYWIHASQAPNDPSFVNGSQWHLNNTGQGGGLDDADIDAPEAWNIASSAGDIVVAVVDSGIRMTHQDLAGNLWRNPGEIPGNGLDDDGNGIVDDVHGINTVGTVTTGNPTDDFGHGTFVSGIVGASGNNGIGVSGVAWNVKIMACKFLDGSGNGSFGDLIDCLNYAIAKGAHVINLSIESPVANAALSNAFQSVRSAGIIVTAAAGNSGTDNDLFPKYPAGLGFDNIIAVTATTRTDGQAYNYGATSVHLGAPGVSIFSTRRFSDSDYGQDSGTSYAAPCVAGAVALMKAKFPALSYQQIISRILGTVDLIPSLTGRCVTGGRLNVAKALSGGFSIQPAPYAWVSTNGMMPVGLTDDGVSTARVLPFTFSFGGRDYTNIYIGANGIIGFVNSGLGVTANMDLPTTASPNAIVCPFWDNLNPAAGGTVWFGTAGVAPYRSAVVSWVDVPHFVTTGGQTRFTFQAILHESGQVAFQYGAVQAGNPSYVRGLSATIGLEDFQGVLAAKYSYNGSQLVTNSQTILFRPDGGAQQVPLLQRIDGPSGQFRLRVTAQVGQRCVLKVSGDLSSWAGLATNIVAASGVWDFIDNAAGNNSQRFYQAVSEP